MPEYNWIDVFEFSSTNGFQVIRFNNTRRMSWCSVQLNLRSPQNAPEIRVLTEEQAHKAIDDNYMKLVRDR